jgi:hypothetical protein
MENSFQSEFSPDYMRPRGLHHSFGGIDFSDVPRRIAACAGCAGSVDMLSLLQASAEYPKN